MRHFLGDLILLDFDQFDMDGNSKFVPETGSTSVVLDSLMPSLGSECFNLDTKSLGDDTLTRKSGLRSKSDLPLLLLGRLTVCCFMGSSTVGSWRRGATEGEGGDTFCGGLERGQGPLLADVDLSKNLSVLTKFLQDCCDSKDSSFC